MTTLMEYGRKKYKLQDWHKTFTKKYWKKDFDSSCNRNHGKSTLPFGVVAKIIKTYLLVYFNELYFGINKDLYAPITGRFKLCQVPSVGRPGIFWYYRPNMSWMAIKIFKLRGTTGILRKLDKRFMDNEDVDLLPDPHALIKKYRKRKQLYRK